MRFRDGEDGLALQWDAVWLVCKLCGYADGRIVTVIFWRAPADVRTKGCGADRAVLPVMYERVFSAAWRALTPLAPAVPPLRTRVKTTATPAPGRRAVGSDRKTFRPLSGDR